MPKFDHFSQRIEFYRFLTENLNMYQNLILIQFNLGVFYAIVFNLIFGSIVWVVFEKLYFKLESILRFEFHLVTDYGRPERK